MPAHLSPWSRGWFLARQQKIHKHWRDIPGVRRRRKRKGTTSIVIHGIGDDGVAVGNTPEQVRYFFTQDPEGVATVTLPGRWADKRETFEKWWVGKKIPPRGKRLAASTNIPQQYLDTAFVPYHIGIHGNELHQWMPLDRVGAHAAGWNSTSIGVAIVRNMRSGQPLSQAEGIGLADTLTMLYLLYGEVLETITHDEANAARKLKKKGCPRVDVSGTISWAQNRARIMMNRKVG